MSWTFPQTSLGSWQTGSTRLGTVVAALGLLLLVGCHGLGPSATVLRPQGPILTRTDALRQQHLERSHYQRDIPMFDRYLESGTDGHQQLPSSFHPVPTRNVFQPPPYTESLWPGPTASGTEVPLGSGDSATGEELPPPRLDNSTPGDAESREPKSLNPSAGSAEPWPAAGDGRRTGEPTHREVVQYPRTKRTDQAVSDWVRGNYGVDVRQAPRLHSALQPYGGSEFRYR